MITVQPREKRGVRARPRLAGQGAAWGALAAAAGAAVVAGVNLRTGLGTALDVALCLLLVALGVPLAGLLAAGLLAGIRRLPRFASGVVAGAMGAVSLLWWWPAGLGWRMGVLIGLLEAALGASAATILAGGPRGAARGKRAAAIAVCALALCGNAALYVFFHSDGAEAARIRLGGAPMPPPLAAPNPAEPGSHAVQTLFYGSGTDRRRPEYGPSAALKTPTVDGSRALPEMKGIKQKLRRMFWGFDVDRLPLNGRVWYPRGPGPFPLALIVHGNHQMEQFSDPGYAYLGELLASRGFILVSVDQNFLNYNWYGDFGGENAARAWLLLEHLKLWRGWNRAPGNPFYGKVDLEHVALIGHSRGGQAAATAVLFNRLSRDPEDALIRFDYGFRIQSVVALAPSDEYQPAGRWRNLENVNYLTLQGSHDSDVYTFDGSRQWERVRFTDGQPWFKAELYIYRANHGQFNTVWGRTDQEAPLSWLLNLKPLLSGDEQRRIAKTYISAFLEATLHGRREYIPLFREHRRIAAWLPDTVYVSRFQDASYRVVSDFSEDADVTTTTLPGGRLDGENLALWREQRIPLREGERQHSGVYLGWSGRPAATYTIQLPGGVAGPRSLLVFSLAADETRGQTESSPLDFTIELETSGGAVARLPLSRFGTLPPPLHVRFTKLRWLDEKGYQKPWEPVFQTFEMPLAAFAAAASGFDPARLRTIRLRFDRGGPGAIILSEVGFSEGPG